MSWTERTLQRLAEQPDHEAALSLWTDKQAAYAAARKGEGGRRVRVRPPSSRPTAITLGRLCQTLRTSARESFTRDEVVRIVEFAAGSASDVPGIFTPPARKNRRSPPAARSSSRELALPDLGPSAEGCSKETETIPLRNS